MDVKKIGEFLAQLRRERNMTQEQLGEYLGVTNKTVSRWENGNYLPPVEMLQCLSTLYGISINEILSGEQLSESAYREKAEENIKSALDSSFTLQERLNFYQKKWRKDHRTSLLIAIGFYAFLTLLGLRYDGPELLAVIFLIAFLIYRRNKMIIYAENRVFDLPAEEQAQQCERRELHMKHFQMMGLILLAISIFACTDLAYNYFSALVPEISDGIAVRGYLGPVIFGRDGENWTLYNFYKGFIVSLQTVGFLGIGNIILACMGMYKGKS